MGNGRFAIGAVFGEHAAVTEAVADLAGFQPERVDVFALAGPNDLVQFLADLPGWKIMAGTILSIFGTGFVSEAGKDAWRAAKPLLAKAPAALTSQFLRLVEAFQREQQNGQDVAIGFIEPTLDYQQRAERVYLTDLEPEEVARQMLIFGNCAHALLPWIEEIKSRTSQPRMDVYMRMRVTDEGKLVVTYGAHERVYSSAGDLLSQSGELPT